MKIYLSNKMSGVPYFNAPWFDLMAARLLYLPGVLEVFNPAEKDREMGFEPMDCPGGTFEEARAAGFALEDALTQDWRWITTTADCVLVGPDWHSSLGAVSEVACAQALRKPVWEVEAFCGHYDKKTLQDLVMPPIMVTCARTTADSPWQPWDKYRHAEAEYHWAWTRANGWIR